MKKKGGNALGVSEYEEGPLIIMQVPWSWADAVDDALNEGAVRRFFEKSVTEARSRGILVPYIYQNYAWRDQDVFASYGAENKKKLQKFQHDLDPDGVFQGGGLCGGYFKINRKDAM
jgi:hypothetical protein